MFKNIVVPIDIAQPSSWTQSIPQAIELAAASSGAATIMTVVRDLKAAFEGAHFPFQVELMTSKACAKLAEIVAEYRGRKVALSEEVRFGSIGREILKTARERKADLIVMTSHLPELKDYLIGPNAAYVAHHATCSVLVLRSPQDREKSADSSRPGG